MSPLINQPSLLSFAAVSPLKVLGRNLTPSTSKWQAEGFHLPLSPSEALDQSSLLLKLHLVVFASNFLDFD